MTSLYLVGAILLGLLLQLILIKHFTMQNVLVMFCILYGIIFYLLLRLSLSLKGHK